MGHKLDNDLLVTPALQQRLQDEANNLTPCATDKVAGWVGLEQSNGDFKYFCYGYTADAGEVVVAHELIKTLNRDIAHDGAWVIQWCLGGRHLNALWLDVDGDVQFTVEFEEDAYGMAENELGNWISQCEEAFQFWHKMMIQALAPSPEQLFKKAKGQKNPSLDKGAINPNREDFDIVL